MNDVLSRSASSSPLTAAHDQDAAGERFVVDVRASLRPAEMVERKLVNLLRSTPLAMSKMQMALRKR